MITPIDSARSAYQLARESRVAGDNGRASALFADAAMSFLSLSVNEHANLVVAREFLIAEHVPDQLVTGAAVTEAAFAEIPEGKTSVSDLMGPYVYIALSHLASLLGEHAAARTFSRAALLPELYGTSFWTVYAKCYADFLAGKPFDLPAFKSLHSEERYWVHYIELMSMMSRGEPSDAKLAEVRGLLAKRNTDKRLRPSQIEGSVFRPAKWDFRLEGVVHANRG
jgi:hypothetical protein